MKLALRVVSLATTHWAPEMTELTNDEIVLPWQRVFLMAYNTSLDLGLDPEVMQLALLSAAMEARIATHGAEAIDWAQGWLDHFRAQLTPGEVRH